MPRLDLDLKEVHVNIPEMHLKIPAVKVTAEPKS
jgi:hypothetical protein